MKREPAVIIAFLFALVQAAWILYTGDPEADAPVWINPILTIIAGFLIRAKVFAPQTLLNAGLNPQKVKEGAEDPDVLPYRGPINRV